MVIARKIGLRVIVPIRMALSIGGMDACYSRSELA